MTENQTVDDLPEYDTSEEGTEVPAQIDPDAVAPADDTSDGTTAPKADPDKLAEHQPDAEPAPADDTPAEAGDDTGVDHEGNDLAEDAQ